MMEVSWRLWRGRRWLFRGCPGVDMDRGIEGIKGMCET